MKFKWGRHNSLPFYHLHVSSATFSLAPRSATRAASPHRDPHIPEPDTLDGNVESCRGFLLQCRRLFDHQPQTYITDGEKISYIINRLRGKALLWAKAADSQGLFLDGYLSEPSKQ
uniref:DUF4939 domain-containing protein n=1 Tax=Monopterus albus TaxID=43700 RepID=A0A3Q3QMC0_MONAL